MLLPLVEAATTVWATAAGVDAAILVAVETLEAGVIITGVAIGLVTTGTIGVVCCVATA